MAQKGARNAAAAALPPATDDAVHHGRGDLTLRAGGDGATARVHRGVVAAYSRVLEDALSATSTGDAKKELSLPGKSKADLDLLVAWLYRSEQLSVSNVEAYCLLSAEYDIPGMLLSVDSWLAEHLEQALPDIPSLRNNYNHSTNQTVTNVDERANVARSWARMLLLAREYKLKRFAHAAKRRVDHLDRNSPQDAGLVLKAQLELMSA